MFMLWHTLFGIFSKLGFKTKEIISRKYAVSHFEYFYLSTFQISNYLPVFDELLKICHLFFLCSGTLCSAFFQMYFSKRNHFSRGNMRSHNLSISTAANFKSQIIRPFSTNFWKSFIVFVYVMAHSVRHFFKYIFQSEQNSSQVNMRHHSPSISTQANIRSNILRLFSKNLSKFFILRLCYGTLCSAFFQIYIFQNEEIHLKEICGLTIWVFLHKQISYLKTDCCSFQKKN